MTLGVHTYAAVAENTSKFRHLVNKDKTGEKPAVNSVSTQSLDGVDFIPCNTVIGAERNTIASKVVKQRDSSATREGDSMIT